MEDEEILSIYMKGWQDSAKEVNHGKDYTGIAQIAYRMGWTDFIVGDDNSSIDLQTNEEILEKIKSS